jgi:hypothetical protein
VQREEQAFQEAHRWARRAHRYASWALLLRHRDRAGRRRAPDRLIHRGRRRTTQPGGNAAAPAAPGGWAAATAPAAQQAPQLAANLRNRRPCT